jgi:hypothetical protein
MKNLYLIVFLIVIVQLASAIRLTIEKSRHHSSKHGTSLLKGKTSKKHMIAQMISEKLKELVEPLVKGFEKELVQKLNTIPDDLDLSSLLGDNKNSAETEAPSTETVAPSTDSTEEQPQTDVATTTESTPSPASFLQGNPADLLKKSNPFSSTPSTEGKGQSFTAGLKGAAKDVAKKSSDDLVKSVKEEAPQVISKLPIPGIKSKTNSATPVKAGQASDTGIKETAKGILKKTGDNLVKNVSEKVPQVVSSLPIPGLKSKTDEKSAAVTATQ